MSKIIAGLSVSVDGYSTGPNICDVHPLGEGGRRLHDWMPYVREARGEDPKTMFADGERPSEPPGSAGSLLMGRRMYDCGEEPWGPTSPFELPVFVVTNRPREDRVIDGVTAFTFVSDGLQSAIARARAEAGDKNVHVAGGAHIIRSLLGAGELDELWMHIVPALLGNGGRMFEVLPAKVELEPMRVIGSPDCLHVKYRVVK